MPSKRDLFLVLLFTLAQADPLEQTKSISLSFGPPATHSVFNTPPLNSRHRPFGDNVNDHSSVLAFAKWYLEHILEYPENSWRVLEDDVRHDKSTGVWRVDVRQFTHNGTVEVVDGNVSLNILNGEVISYGDSFYRGPAPDFLATDYPDGDLDYRPFSFGLSSFNLHSYCSATSQVISQAWMQQNPKWAKWRNQIQRQRKTRRGREKYYQRENECYANIESALEKCTQEHSPSRPQSDSSRTDSVRFRQDVFTDFSTDIHGDIPPECIELSFKQPLSYSPGDPFTEVSIYDEKTCSWNFTTNRSTTSAFLESLRQSHCELRHRPRSPRASQNGTWYMESRQEWNLEQLIDEDESELMEREGIMDPALAAIKFAASLPSGENGFVWDHMDDARAALGKISVLRRPGSEGYAFELKNVPDTDGPVNATLVYVQTPPLKSTQDRFNLGNNDEQGSTSFLIPTWKLSVSSKDGQKFDGYIEAQGRGALVRLLDYAARRKRLQELRYFPTPAALVSLTGKAERAEGCFGWGEAAALRAGVEEFYNRSKTGSSSKKEAKLLTYRSLDGPLYWGVERMGHVWAEIISSVNQSITAHNDNVANEDVTLDNSNPTEATPEPWSLSSEGILTSLIQPSFALLPCNPTFVMARDALIQAEKILFGEKYACDMWKGFAERGLGVSARPADAKTWTPWGGGKRKDGFDIPEECTVARTEKDEADRGLKGGARSCSW